MYTFACYFCKLYTFANKNIKNKYNGSIRKN